MTTTCSIDAIDDARQWHALLGAVARPHLTQAWSYGEAKREVGGWDVKRLVLHRAGTPAALCQVLIRRVLGLGLVSRVNRGPLLIGAQDGEPARDSLASLRRRWRYFLRGVLLIAPGMEATAANRGLLAQAGFRRRSDHGWHSSILDLAASEAELRSSLVATWRHQLKGAEKLSLGFDVSGSREALDWLMERHVENMRAKGFVGPSPAFVRAVHSAQPDACAVSRVLHEGRPVAGMLTVRFGQSAEAYIICVSDEARKIKAGNALYWNTALELKRRGVRWFDLGGYGTRDRYGHFKRGMGGYEYGLCGEWMAW